MSQTIFADINPNTTSGTQLATYLNDFKAALLSGLKGPSRPPELLTAGMWVDDSLESGSDLWTIKLYNGTTDLTLFTINLATDTITVPGSDNSFEILKVSGDTAGALLKLSKRRTSGAQVQSGDTIGEVQYIGRDNASGNPVVARIRSVATDTMTASITGASLIFEQVKTGANTLIEVFRLLDGKLGIGLIAPTSDLHVRGNNGVTFERLADDTTAALVSVKKQRVTGLGGTLSADGIGSYEYKSTDDAGTIFSAIKLDAVAGENHTPTARGTSLSIKIIKATESALSEVMTFGAEIYAKVVLRISSLVLDAQSIATAATIASLNADKAVVNFTGATDTLLQGINAAGNTKVILLYNGSTGKITVDHENVSATATNRITLPNSRAIVLLPGEATELFYNTVSSRWSLKSGSGGGGSRTVGADTTLTAGDTIAISLTDIEQTFLVKGDTTAIDLSATPFGSSAPTNGTRITLIGSDAANTVGLLFTNAAKGYVGPDISVGLYQSATVEYNLTLDRYVLVSRSN